MNFILDFDRVLFDWDAYKAALTRSDKLDLLVEPEVWDEFSPSDFYYDDVVDFLTSVDKDRITIISAYTPSYGEHAEAYQRRKIADSRINTYAREVVVMTGNKAPFVCERTTEVTVFVDDKLDHLQSVKAMCPSVQCLQMVRSDTLSSPLSTSSDIPIVKNFAAVNAIVETL